MKTILRTRRGAIFFSCALALCLIFHTASESADALQTATTTDGGSSTESASGRETTLLAGSPDSSWRRSGPWTATADWSNFVVAIAAGDQREATAPPAPPLALDELPPTPAPLSAPTVGPAPVPTATPAPAPTVASPTLPPAGDAVTERGRAVLAQVGFDPASVGYTISFHPYTGSYRGLTFTRRRHIEIYVRSSMGDDELRYVIAHEIGHAVDHIRNTHEDRERWRASRGIAPQVDWWPNHMASDYGSPSGDFAECFAAWRIGSASHSSWGSCAAVTGLMAELASG